MKDYSATPLWRKLGIREGSRLRLIGAPGGFAIPELPPVITVMRGTADTILLFATRRADVKKRVPLLAAALHDTAALWVAWPKKSAALATDVDFDVVQTAGLDAGVVDNKTCRIDDTWQAMRFVRRRRDRASA